MNWKGRRESDNVEDRRGMSKGTLVGGGIGTVVLAVVVMLLGGDPSALFGNQATTGGTSAPLTQEDQERKQFVSVVLADTEDVWNDIFSKMGQSYVEPTLVLFRGQVESACGVAGASVGPFYCPGDQKLYIDLSFYDELQSRFGAPGDFAQAYVIAHEVGHHVQNLLGITEKVHSQRARLSDKAYNKLSVRLELQADFLAGVWAHHAQTQKNILDRDDISEAVRCAAAIGDDRLQEQAQGHVVPDTFTHGTSEQRVRWFTKGWDSGRLADGDTFNANRL